ncbi:MAG TPA: asparagine synthase (glutamine-hydrolyzing) [Pyrinomonadaceae bacterium]|nr:asparagine synthase (glutamine-hydrolyzing) [Pyrinomonadaceae bacterium]
MCGIAGVLNRSGTAVALDVLTRMGEAIAYRGPDGAGRFTDGPLGFAHQRLAIIDLSAAAAQPMTTSDGRYTLVYNGELYNFRELRGELEKLGRCFVTRSDTEVLLQAYAQWGVECLPRFNGMFAFALWDHKAEALFLARDRYGIKPLYYCANPKHFLFASEVKGILAHPSCSVELDHAGLIEYFTFQNFFTDRTLFRNIKLLSAGSYLYLSPLQTGDPAPIRYWDYRFIEPSGPMDEHEYIEELDRLFVQGVRRQLVSDVPLGAYLSGGIDSGAITAVAAREMPYIKTFTAGFDLTSASGIELTFDERDRAEYMSYLFQTEHYEMVLKAGDMERVLPRLARHIEEPRVGQSYPNFYAAQLASKFVKVVLAGGGGDELFGGYPWRYYRAVINDDFEQYVDKYYRFWHRLIPNSAIQKLFRPIWNEVRHVWTRDIFRDVFLDHAADLDRPEDYINHSLYFEAKTFLHGLLVMEDKLSMAHGLETRLPFLDNDVVDFAMKLPVRLKLGNLSEVVRLNENEPGPKTERYFHTTRDGKLLLRKTMQRHVPVEVTERVKQGFSAPDASWFRGESIEYVKKLLLDPNARIYRYLDFSAASELVEDHLNGRVNRRLLIWSLLSFEWWCRTFEA